MEMKAWHRRSLQRPVKPALTVVLCTCSIILALEPSNALFGQIEIEPLVDESPLTIEPLSIEPLPIELIRAGLANVEPVNPAAVPEVGTFYMLRDYLKSPDSAPPYPMNPWTNCPVYPFDSGAFNSGNVFLVDNAPLSRSSAFGQMLTTSSDPALFDEDGDPESESSCLSWPVGLTNLVLVDPGTVLTTATYYMYLDQTNGESPVPYPENICTNCDVYYLCESNQYLVDDRSFTRPPPLFEGPVFEPKSLAPGALVIEILGCTNGAAQLRITNTAAWQDYTIQSAPTPTGPWTPEKVVTGTDAQNSITTSVPIPNGTQSGLFFRAHVGADALPLWLEAVGASGGWVYINLHHTSSNDTYEIFSTESLPNGNWQSEGVVQGLDGVTSVMIPMANRQMLFVKAVDVSLDSDGQGLPDWWQIAFFGYTGVDPWGNADGDAFSNIEEYYKGTSPTSFDTPPAPIPFVAFLTSGGTTATITWKAGTGPISHYILKRSDYNPDTDNFTAFQIIAQPSATDTSFQDTGAFTTGNPDGGPAAPEFFYGRNSIYQIEAVYASGNSLPAYAQLEVGDPAFAVDARLTRNSTGRWQITCPAFPARIQKLRLSWFNFQNDEYTFHSSQDISVTNLMFGSYVIPDSEIIQHTSSHVLWVRGVGANEEVGNPVNAGMVFDDAPFFVDGRQHALENLRFLLRGATLTRPIGISDTWHTNHAESGFLVYEQYIWYPDEIPPFVSLNDLKPLRINYDFRTRLFSTNEVPDTSGWKTNFLTVPGPAVLSTPDPYWIWQYNVTDLADLALSAVGTYPNQLLHLASDAHNLFGLNVETGLVNYRTVDPGTGLPNVDGFLIAPGQTERVGNFQYGAYVGSFFSQTAPPTLSSTLGYYFAPVFSPGPVRISWNAQPQRHPLPILPEFAPTNQSPLIVASVGEPILIGGWARKQIMESNPIKFAYLGQYFESASKINSGTITTNRTGILSPYGEFFPTEPGPVALVTMTNWGENVHGTGIVQVISLNVDGNHDGTMDFSYFGPDQTTPNRPYRFWVNDNNDSGDDAGDGIPGQGPRADTIPGSFYDTIQGTRDLVDFFPVYVNLGGLFQTSAYGPSISPTDTSYRFLLKQEDSALFVLETDLTATNYMNYLRETNFLPSIAPNWTCTVVPSTGYQLSTNFLTNAREGMGILLFEASKPTKAPLRLEIWHGTNLIAQTSAYLSISGVEDMFRHKNLVNEAFPIPGGVGAPADRLTDSSVPNETETNEKNFVFLHGYNVNPDQARGNASDVFKKLYWSGSHAKFYAVTWKGNQSQVGSLTPNYHTNVVNAFLTAPHLANFLTTLTNEPTIIAAHSLGNMVVLSAISDRNAPFTKCFMIDAAVAIEAIDPSTSATVPMIHSDWINGNYDRRLWASSWYGLFPPGDGRQSLTWSNRLANLPFTNIYNFYSSGEEVLRTHTGSAPIITIPLYNQVVVQFIFKIDPIGTYAWAWQEKMKGVCPGDWILGSSHGGWKFNRSYDTNSAHLPYTQANTLPNSQLRTNSFFDFASGLFTNDIALESTSGSAYAQANRDRILADAIPALTLPVGANPVPLLTPFVGADRNYDMQELFENGWPAKRMQNQFELNNWWHSDFRQVAYTFTWPLYDRFVNLGNLK